MPDEVSSDRIPDILALQARVLDRFGPDRIWVHDGPGLTRLFGLGPDFLALGVWCGGTLIAASLSRRMSPSEVSPLTPGLPWSGEPAHIGLNTLSLPGSGSGPQMIRLLRERGKRLRGRGVEHLFGGVAPDHPVSLGCAFRAGAIGVGHLRVPGGTELLLWHGPGTKRDAPRNERVAVPAGDLDLQARLMRDGLVAVGLDPRDRSALLFSPFRPGGSG